MANQRRAGLIQLTIDGVLCDLKGDWTYNLGKPKREPIIGADGVHGYKEVPQVAFLEGEITDRGDLNLEALVGTSSATIVLQLANGKNIALRDGWFAGEGTGNTGEGNIGVRFEGKSAAELT